MLLGVRMEWGRAGRPDWLKLSGSSLSDATFPTVESPRENVKMGKHLLYVQEVAAHFMIVTYYIKWVTTSWTHSNFPILG